MDIFNKKKVKQLENEIWELKRETVKLDEQGKENSKLKSELTQLQSQLSEAQSKIRTQTEADLYFECEKIKIKLLKGKKKEDLSKDLEYRNTLQSLLAQQQQAAIPQYGILGSLGTALVNSYGWK